MINEILGDVPASPGGDANCNGATSETADEFVELLNVSMNALLLGGVTIWDDNAFTNPTQSTKYTFASGFVLGPGEAVTVFASAPGTVTSSPWCLTATAGRIGDSVALGNSAGFGLSNAGDTVHLTAGPLASSLKLHAVTYPATGVANQSYARSPDGTGTFAAYLGIPGHATDRAMAPGSLVTGYPFALASAP